MAHPSITAKIAEPFSILILKHDLCISELLERFLRRRYPTANVIVCTTCAGALQRLRQGPVWLGVIGLNLPDMDGLDVIQIMLTEALVEKILIFSGRNDERSRMLLSCMPIAGYFNSTFENVTTLVRVIDQIASGQKYFSLKQNDRSVRTKLGQILTDQELKVFAVIGDGSDNNQSATRLGISPNTVHTHRQRIMRKLKLQTRTELVREALRLGVVRITATQIFYPGFRVSTSLTK